MKIKNFPKAIALLMMASALPLASHADDGLVLEVSKVGVTNPNAVAIAPFTGNQAMSQQILTKLNQTELKSGDNNLPNQPRDADDVMGNIHAWRNTGYRYVVIGDSRMILGNKTATNFQIIDLTTGKPLSAAQTHISGTSSAELQAAATAISNKIYQAITGKSNAADDLTGSIAYVEETGDARQKTSTLKVLDVASGNVAMIDKVNGAILTPSFSPDGSQIAYTVLQKDALPVIYIASTATHQKTLATPFKGHNLSPSFSPDGSALLFSGSHDANNPNIYRLDLIANRLSALTALSGAENSPTLLSNNQLIFTADNGTRSQSIYRMNAGASPTRITTGSNPRVSKDGTQLAYVQAANLVVSNINGANAKVIDSVGTEGMASFSPNGTSIVYASQQGGKSQLIIKRLGSAQTTILPTMGIVKDPTWSAR